MSAEHEASPERPRDSGDQGAQWGPRARPGAPGRPHQDTRGLEGEDRDPGPGPRQDDGGRHRDPRVCGDGARQPALAVCLVSSNCQGSVLASTGLMLEEINVES